MELECLIRRVGSTTVVLEKTVYTFRPIPGTQYKTSVLKNKDPQTGQIITTNVDVPNESTSVCDVQNQKHIDHLLRTGQFRKYDPKLAQAEASIERGNPYVGFAIEKYEVGSVAGYVAADKRKKPWKYAGAGGDWKATKAEAGQNPFKTEIELFNFLKEEVAFQDSNPPEESEDLNKDLEALAGNKKATKK